MAYTDENLKEAETLYCVEGMKLEDIEKMLNIPYSTLNRWKKEKGWSEKKDACNFSFSELEGIYVQRIQELILDVKNNKVDLLQPGIADALAKNFSVIQKINPTKRMFGLVLTFIKVVDDYLANTDASLRIKMLDHWDGIKEKLNNYLENKNK